MNATRRWLGLIGLATLWPATDHAADQTVRPWDDYRTILWMGDRVRRRAADGPLLIERLRPMGIHTAMVYDGEDPQPWVTHRFPYYVENLVNRALCLKWNWKVRNWEKFLSDWMRTGRPETALVREYCLDDAAWRAGARPQVQTAVRCNAPHAPLAYYLQDELAGTISANPFDYEFHPLALARFRQGLTTQYRPGVERPPVWPLPPLGPAQPQPDQAQADPAALQALNAQWQTQCADWHQVKPFRTDQIKHRMASGQALPHGAPNWRALQQRRFDPVAARREPTRWNFSPWCDFRASMDLSLAAALAALRQAARELDPRTPVGIEGTQRPHAFGGYDLWRLAQVAQGELPKRNVRVFVMPQSLALSAAEADQIRAFATSKAPAQAGARLLVCDGTPGLFDLHGQLRAPSPLEDLFPPAQSAACSSGFSAVTGPRRRPGDIAQYAGARLGAEPGLGWAEWLGGLLQQLPPEVRVHRFKLGAARLLAFEQNISYRLSDELAQAGGNQALEAPIQLQARLAASVHLYELRAGVYLGHTDRLTFRLDPVAAESVCRLAAASACGGPVDLSGETSAGAALSQPGRQVAGCASPAAPIFCYAKYTPSTNPVDPKDNGRAAGEQLDCACG